MNQPNIILITVDGLRWDALGCAGNPDVRTPNIDALASHGIRFINAFAPCAHDLAGRHTFLTGLVPEQLTPDRTLVDGDEDAHPLLLPTRLRAAGYVTGAVGALDLGRDDVEGTFDHFHTTGCEGLDDEYSAWLVEEGYATPDDEDSDRAPLLSEACHPTTWTGNRAVRFTQSVQEPFFVWASFPRPRWPLDPPVPWKHMYQPSRLTLPGGHAPAPMEEDVAHADPEDHTVRTEASFRRILAAWYGCISHVDRQIGRLLATLTARGRTNNIFVITAGRGSYLGYHGLLHTAPGPLYEPVIRVPLILGGAAGQRKETTDPALVSSGDIVSTIFDVLRLDQVGVPGGRSLTTQLREEGAPHRRAIVLGDPAAPIGIRSARYKWLGPEGAEGEALYDLQADPFERHNLYSERQSLAIRKMLLAATATGVSESNA